MTEKKKTDFIPLIVLGVVILLVFGGCTVIASQDYAGQRKQEAQQNLQNTQQKVDTALKEVDDKVYQQTQVGMTEEQVNAIAGAPDRCYESESTYGVTKMCSWGKTSVTIMDGKVNSKSKL